MINKPVEHSSPALWWVDSLSQLPCKTKSLSIDPLSLVLCYEKTSPFFSFLDLVEVVHDDSYEQVEDKLTTKDHENYKVDD